MLTSDNNGSNSSNTEQKLKKNGKKLFEKGFDPRRNLKGRPRTFDQARILAQAISHEEITTNQGKTLTVAEAVLRKLALSKEPQALKIFLEYAFGPPPTKSEVTTEHKSKLFLNYSHEESNVREDHSRLSPSVSQSAN